MCGGGVFLYFFYFHYFSMYTGLGNGSNNFVEHMALKNLLQFAKEKGYVYLQVFKDSMLAINWFSGVQRCHNKVFLPLAEELQCITYTFDNISCVYV